MFVPLYLCYTIIQCHREKKEDVDAKYELYSLGVVLLAFIRLISLSLSWCDTERDLINAMRNFLNATLQAFAEFTCLD